MESTIKNKDDETDKNLKTKIEKNLENKINNQNLADKKNVNDNSDELNKINFKRLLLIFALGYTSFTSYACYSLLAPFFPREAEKKGLSPAQYGLVFSAYEIVRLFISPICSIAAIKMTPKVFLITGIFIKSFCTCLFGILIYAKTAESFFYCSIIVRVFWAFGGSATTTGNCLIGILQFPKHVSLIFATIEMGVGIGYMIGPGIGGFLYEYGGYSLPFYVMSVLCILGIFPIIFLVKESPNSKSTQEKEAKTSFWKTLKIEGVHVNLIASAATCLICGFSEATLDFHIREIGDYTASQTGGIFLLSALVYAMSTQFWAFMAKINHRSYIYILLGVFSQLVSYILIGPIPGLPVEPNITFVLISQIITGFSLGNVFVLSFDDTVKEAIKYLPNNDDTMAKISGLFTASYAFGNSFGPAVGGFLVDYYGYRIATIPLNITTALLFFYLIYYIKKYKK